MAEFTTQALCPNELDNMKLADIKENILKMVPNIFEVSPVLFAYVYGSIVIDQAHPFSDLDIAIYVPRMSIKNRV
ncbi:MAG: nucleotidyltransferase domain-containing protein [Desulfobacteraceae bacterium]|nr:nucleotidyltransferase domain-containing protein [Desulfobacteraceae bacterium]MBC2756752.1 nucleotidyltransferase domain-containing protein [Desulfobacteraceae bacterium]